MDSPDTSFVPPGRLLAVSAALSGAETVQTAITRAIELVETTFEQPVASVCAYDAATDTVTTLESSVPPAIRVGGTPDRIPESLVGRAGERGDGVSSDGTPEATVDTDPRDPIQAEVLAPVGSDRLLRVGVTELDRVSDTEIATIEGIAANLQTALSRIDHGQPTSIECDVARALFEQSTDPTLVSEPDGTLVAANQAAVELTGRDRDALLRNGLPDIVADTATDTVREHLERAVTGATDPLTTTLEHAHDGERTVELTSHQVDVDGEGYIRTTAHDSPSGVRSQPGRSGDANKDDATALRRLNELAAGVEEFDEPIERLLSLGCDHFGLDTGILSHVDGDDYAVETVVDATGAHETGAVYDLGDTMCDATLAGDATGPLAFADVSNTDHRDHPAAESVRAYIAAPVVVDGDTYGTVNFSMERPRSEAFRPEEEEFVTLVAQWIGTEIERRHRFEELERYETILEAVDDPVYALDADGRFTFVNEAAERQFGYDEEILGRYPSVGMDESDVERMRAQIQGLLTADDRSTTVEFDLETADGGHRTVENRLALIGDDEFRGTAGVLRDVTARKERQRQLESFQQAIEEAADGIAILDDGAYTYVDRTHVEMYGFEDTDQLVGATWRELYDDEEAARLESEAFPALESEGYWRGMVTGSRPDGSTFPAELSLTIVEDGRLVCTVRDETQRRERERELKLKERAMDEANVGIQITDPTRDDNPLVYVNDGFERITGYDREDALGRNPRFLQAQDSDSDQVARLREAIDTATPVSLELQNRRHDGTTYWSRLSITPVEDEDGTVRNYIGIQQDVTERREQEIQREARVAFLKRIYEVTTDPALTFEEKITGLLEAGRDHLDLPYGFLTRIERGDGGSGVQTIVEALGSHESLQPGESAPLEQSYCRKTVEQDGLRALTHATETTRVDDPAYETFGLETYIGSEVVAGDDLYGTLCFASREPRDRSFDEFERSFIRLAGRWAGYEIDRRNTRAELREQRERLELTLSGTSTGLAEWDLKTDAVTWNETLTEMVGRDVDSIEAFRTVVHPDDRDRVQREIETMVETDSPWAGEFRVIDDDGDTLWLRTRATPVYDEAGEPVRVLATGTDISDEKRAERERRRNERRFESLFDDPGMLVGLLDTDGRLLDANETAMEYVDATPEELCGEPFWETPWWTHSEELVTDLREWTQRAADGEYVEYTATHPDSEGNRRDVTGTVRPVTDESGTVRSLLVTGRDVTEREQSQRELRDRQQKLDLVLSNTDTSVAELDLSNGTMHWDEMMGDNDIGSPETVDDFIETVHPEDRRRVQSDLEEMIDTSEPLYGEYRLVDENGETVWISAQAVPVENDGGPVERIVAIATDVTDLKQREQALEASQNRYRTLLQAAPDPVFIADAETGEIAEVNAAAEEILGRPRDEIVGCDQVELHPQDDTGLYRTAFEQSVGHSEMISELPDGTQPKLRTADGGTVPVEINADTVELPGGPVMYGVFRDISQRRERERELELKERAMDEANVGITISDPDQEDNPLVYVNDGFLDQTGYTRADAVGRNCRFLQADDRDQAALDDLRDAIAADEAITVELRNYRKDGERFWNRLSVTPVYDDDGALTNHIGVQQDVTEEKTREKRLRALHESTRDLLLADSIGDAAAVAVESLAAEFDFQQSALYLREDDALVSTAMTGASDANPPDRVEEGQTPLWDALETGEPVQYDDCGAIDDGVDRGDVTASAYFPVGDHGALAVGATDPDRLGEVDRRLVEVLTGNLVAVLDRLEREASLRASEQRYRDLAENIPNGGVLTFDADLEYRLAAGELLPELGLEASNVTGMSAGTVIPDIDDKDELVSRLRAALDGERTDRRIEIGERTLRVHVAPVEASDGHSDETRGLILAQDVTEEAQREQDLFEERERFRLLTESVDEYAFVVVDEDGVIQTWNESATDTFGYDTETALGMSMAELHPEADRESGLLDRLLQQARVAGESAHEGRRVRADGSEFYADVRHAPLEADDGAFRGYATIVRDMTDKRRERRRTERFVEESDDVVTIVDPDGTVTYASGSANRVLGYDPDDLVGENLFDYIHPDSREGAMETFFAGLAEHDGSFQAECRFESGDGEWLNVEGQCRNMIDDDAIGGMLLYFRDVTENKKRARWFESIFNQTFQFTGLLQPDGTVVEVNEAALEFGGVERDAIVGDPFSDAPWWTHSEAVHDDVVDAIEQAANGEFVRYETEVRGADGLAAIDFSVKPVTDEDDEVSLLVVEGRDVTDRQQRRRHLEVMQRVMRHNMRNDITKMRGWSQLIAEETDGEKRAEQFETVERVLDKWESMTEKMGEIRTLLESHQKQTVWWEAGTLVEDAVASTREAYADEVVTTEVPDAGLQIPATLLDAVRELVENAAEASADPAIEVEVGRSADGWTEVLVRDDGPGLPDMEADVLETGEETPLSHGKGLGLWMVRMIVTQAGGDAAVESTDDGTEVCLRLPARRTVEDEAQAETTG